MWRKQWKGNQAFYRPTVSGRLHVLTTPGLPDHAQGAPLAYQFARKCSDTARQLYDRIGVHTSFIKYQRPL